MTVVRQRIWELMTQTVIEKLDFSAKPDQKQVWIDEANQWRLPYWDWALHGAQVPLIYQLASIDLLKPDGTTEPIQNNPLARYQLLDENKKAQTMGSLPDPYKISSDDPYPVSIPQNTTFDLRPLIWLY